MATNYMFNEETSKLKMLALGLLIGICLTLMIVSGALPECN